MNSFFRPFIVCAAAAGLVALPACSPEKPKGPGSAGSAPVALPSNPSAPPSVEMPKPPTPPAPGTPPAPNKSSAVEKPAETKLAAVELPVTTKIDVAVKKEDSAIAEAKKPEPAAVEKKTETAPVAVVAKKETPAAAKSEPVQLAAADVGFIPPQATLGGKSSKPAPVIGVKQGDWNQWGGSSLRNNVPAGKNIAFEWDLGGSYLDSGEFKKEEASENVLWAMPIGSQSYGNPVIANGKCYIGTNNGHGWLSRYPANVDLGCLLAFNQEDGKFLWQHSSEKLPTGRVHDWPLQGICCSPLVEGDRLWFVSSRGLVLCLDTEGFHDGENDGDKKEPNENKDEADVVWTLDMMNELGVSQHNMCSCSVTDAGDYLFVCTSNGVDESHINLPAPNAPSFLMLDKKTGKIIWKDGSPGMNILHGQWSSPAYAVIDGVPQVIFAGGDGWLYAFKGDAGKDGKPELLWSFDANPKESKYVLGGRGTRNEIIATPVIYNDLVYLAVGQDPEHGEGIGHLWCIDPKKRGDISAELAVKRDDPKKPIPHRRLQAVETDKGEMAVPNPNSGVVWHYSEYDGDGNKKIDFEETMHRTCGTVVIKDDLLYLADFSGLFHCVDATSGKPYWTHDLFAAVWGSALIVDGKVFVGDEEGKISVFKHDKVKDVLAENEMGNSVYTSPVVAEDKLYIANKTHLFAIAPNKK